MQRARDHGYKVYLYYVGTEDPLINVQRVQEIRVKEGGHNVPKNKIIDRYHRSMEQFTCGSRPGVPRIHLGQFRKWIAPILHTQEISGR